MKTMSLAPLEIALILPLAVVLLGKLASAGNDPPQTGSGQGVYFTPLDRAPGPLPTFAGIKDRLPAPVFDENPVYVAMYWKAWELACHNFYTPRPGSGFVSLFIDAAFNQNIFLWDTCFLTMFCNHAHPLVPGIGSLDNFYAKQHGDGEICREIDRTTGRDFWPNRDGKSFHYVGRDAPQPPPRVTLDALNHPILAWAEVESFRLTGDLARLARVYEPLVRYHRALQTYLRQGNGLYMTDWASMDNSPRNAFLDGGAAVDTSAEMVLFARHLGVIADLLGKGDAASAFRREAAELTHRINATMWDPQRRFYFDLKADGHRAPARTIAAYWTLLADVASPDQADALAAELRNPRTFGRRHRVPTVPADEPSYDPAGGYWRGAAWAPTNLMVIRGLQRSGKNDLARAIALEHLQRVAEVYQSTGTLWENYAPDAPVPGKPAKGDFVGWTGIVPIVHFLEHAIGLEADAGHNRLTWNLVSDARCGCERYRFNSHVTTLIAEPADAATGRRTIHVESDGPFELRLRRGETIRIVAVMTGSNCFEWH